MVSDSGAPLLPELPESEKKGKIPGKLTKEVWEESKKLWEVVGPGVFMQVADYTMIVTSQAFVGYLGDQDLAAFSIANTVIDDLSFGFLVCVHLQFFNFTDYLRYTSEDGVFCEDTPSSWLTSGGAYCRRRAHCRVRRSSGLPGPQAGLQCCTVVEWTRSSPTSTRRRGRATATGNVRGEGPKSKQAPT
ncbi:hypothetical protein PR202_gb22362 [Eleusine coracana subsp. coracana]|uniref:Uncharacterized protein n=1 Tax=Eleusine coracana subsp. coracana TaxID=191504 RepID=A0AAV5FG33_ELECO|nr:hypothetical protein PR202_gb22362 [Eleusine coracana subsp. coracana]